MYICSCCKFKTNDKTKYARHLNSARHKKKIAGEVKMEYHQCDRCDYQCKNNSNFNKHMLIHTGKPYDCLACSMTFRDKQHLYQHLLNQTHIKNFKSKYPETLKYDYIADATPDRDKWGVFLKYNGKPFTEDKYARGDRYRRVANLKTKQSKADGIHSIIINTTEFKKWNTITPHQRLKLVEKAKNWMIQEGSNPEDHFTLGDENDEQDQLDLYIEIYDFMTFNPNENIQTVEELDGIIVENIIISEVIILDCDRYKECEDVLLPAKMKLIKTAEKWMIQEQINPLEIFTFVDENDEQTIIEAYQQIRDIMSGNPFEYFCGAKNIV
ncbi:MAG: hypothetical protein Hyperionvirus3_42 [Hyperionvirus sp.]|uniref:C2H2-type domain-containing protein n=1 Tax=Hyperionvirus sp. TaxID=2487770 RepID=A0A3G5A6K9_9VIRU|nr:MAG: hypothetical protein Hyperionvirus3_42 [Hyperionvirus sp.]